jgi:hypothetical protein
MKHCRSRLGRCSLFTSTCGLPGASEAVGVVSLVAELQQIAYTFPFCNLSTELGQPRPDLNCLAINGHDNVKTTKSDTY